MFREAHPSRRRFGGFTLVELLLVMALLTIVIALTTPQLSRFFKGRMMDSEARRLLALIRYGQERAASEGFPMLLWVDVEQKRYGLEAEAGYEEQDPRPVEYALDRDLRIELVEIAETPWPRPNESARIDRLQERETSRLQQKERTSEHADLPGLRLLPDGSIDESSPESLLLVDGENRMLEVRLTRNRLSYEIADANRDQ